MKAKLGSLFFGLASGGTVKLSSLEKIGCCGAFVRKLFLRQILGSSWSFVMKGYIFGIRAHVLEIRPLFWPPHGVRI